jgi:putative flippase GtrA
VLILKFLKFCIVGFSGMVVDFGFTWLCKEKFKWNKYVSNSIGFVLAATNNYIWNRWWTFQSDNANIPIEYGKFLVISVIGLGLNNLVIYLLHEKLKLNFYFAKLIAIGVVTVWNFVMNYRFTF